MAHERLQGLVAAPHTPMGPDGTVALNRIERQADLLVANGVVGAFVCGSTGEGPSLAVQERQQVAERWVKVAPPGALRVIVHVGHNSLAESKVLAAHAQRIGAAAIGALPPFYFRPAIEDVAAFLAEVAAAAPELPLYYYHIPALTGVKLKVHDLLARAGESIPTLAGAKFTYEDLMDFHQCLLLDGGRFNMLFGRDEILLAALALGAEGAVGTTYNFAAPLYTRIIEAFRRGDLEAARADQARAVEMVAEMLRFNGVAASKAIMRMIGVDCGPPRLPLRPLTDPEDRALRHGLEAIGFFDYCSKLP